MVGLRPVKESRSCILNGIMDALKDVNFNMIDVVGMGVVGKIRLVKEVIRQVKYKQMFEIATFVIVLHEINSRS